MSLSLRIIVTYTNTFKVRKLNKKAVNYVKLFIWIMKIYRKKIKNKFLYPDILKIIYSNNSNDKWKARNELKSWKDKRVEAHNKGSCFIILEKESTSKRFTSTQNEVLNSNMK